MHLEVCSEAPWVTRIGGVRIFFLKRVGNWSRSFIARSKFSPYLHVSADLFLGPDKKIGPHHGEVFGAGLEEQGLYLEIFKYEPRTTRGGDPPEEVRNQGCKAEYSRRDSGPAEGATDVDGVGNRLLQRPHHTIHNSVTRCHSRNS